MLGHLLDDPVEPVNPSAYLFSRLNQNVRKFLMSSHNSFCISPRNQLLNFSLYITCQMFLLRNRSGKNFFFQDILYDLTHATCRQTHLYSFRSVDELLLIHRKRWLRL